MADGGTAAATAAQDTTPPGRSRSNWGLLHGLKWRGDEARRYESRERGGDLSLDEEREK
ncbi:hypothetical protein Emag_007204 [Eimeria magna]